MAPSDAIVGALLTRLGEDPDGRVAAEAAWALGRLPRGHTLGPLASRGLRRALLSRRGIQVTDAAVRCNGLGALARLGLAELRDIEWLTDPDPGARANRGTGGRSARPLATSIRCRSACSEPPAETP